MIFIPKGGVLIVKNISAEEDSQKQGTRFQKKNEHQERQKGTGSQKTKGQI